MEDVQLGNLGQSPMDEDKTAFYEVFRASKRLGPYDKERLARSREQLDGVSPVPVGTVAADAIRRLAKLEGPGAETFRRTARSWSSIVDAHVRREFTKEQAAALGRVWDRIEQLAPYAERREGKRVVGLWYKVPGPPDMSGAMLLSIIFGTQAGRLRLCKGCDLPFVTDAAHPQRRTCDECRPQRQHGLKAWHLTSTSKTIWETWDRVQHRWVQRVHAAKMTPEERDQQRRQAMSDLRRVQSGEMSVEEWLQRWDQGTKQQAGRRSRTTAKHGQEVESR